MRTHHFSPVPQFAVHLSITRKNGQKTDLQYNQDNGWLNTIPVPGDIITISIGVDPQSRHLCYTLDTKGNKFAKKAIGPGIYEKSVKVTSKEFGLGLQVARWPGNMFCLDIEGKSFNIGIYTQRNSFFFVIEESIADQEGKDWKEGEVKWFSLLRGFGAASSKNKLFDHRIYWENLPRRQSNMHRYLNSGDIIVPKTIIDTNSDTTFRTEIIEVKYVEYAK